MTYSVRNYSLDFVLYLSAVILQCRLPDWPVYDTEGYSMKLETALDLALLLATVAIWAWIFVRVLDLLTK